ncbi:XRE family transcriptional regulator [Gluconacetobacter entanii]|uniref:XRE family transcriptional regulator n=2 Tax=Gluconacetobacter entanii TaxID=108528 RepID=A0ABT3K1D0_9PROT|nr:helix-turn-helix domain-containing protein [Gluconacetobacter entanii]MCW4589203.1 XRE family transcriptional regulator [Gluconacetobacter entanii]MCW4592758.1 XRE family transcriptional regulator [Gluconacetobacter entanii]NPC90402.1 helix-turn-helix domain-containing protein [Gluconacetobacter entanii]
MKVSGKMFEPPPKGTDTAAGHIGRRLREIRKLAGLTQAQLAERLNIGQSAVTGMERRKDIHVSTLRDYLAAMGATLRIHARFDDADAMINNLREADFRFEQIDENQFLLPIFGEDRLPPHRDVVFSIKPEYSRKIVTGEKTIELRRRFPMSVPAGTTALIYETSPTRALSGIAEIGEVHRRSPEEIWRSFSDQACIARKDFDTYFDGVDRAFAIELRHGRSLPRPLELSELRERFSFEPPQSFLYATPKMREALLHERAKISN